MVVAALTSHEQGKELVTRGRAWTVTRSVQVVVRSRADTPQGDRVECQMREGLVKD